MQGMLLLPCNVTLALVFLFIGATPGSAQRPIVTARSLASRASDTWHRWATPSVTGGHQGLTQWCLRT